MNDAATYDAIADPTRRQILDLLRNGSLNAGVIASRFRGMSRPAVSKHLSVLREARLVRARKSGREQLYTLNAAPLRGVDAWLRQYQSYWEGRLGAFKAHVEASQLEGEDA